MTRNTAVAALAVAIGIFWGSTGSALAQSRAEQNAQAVNQDLTDLGNAQLQLEFGNARVQADENARQRALHSPTQTVIGPALRDYDHVDENLSTGEPLLFDDHKDVRHDTDNKDLSSPE